MGVVLQRDGAWYVDMDVLPEPMAITRYQDGCYEYVNLAYCAAVGRLRREEIIGRTSIDVGVLSRGERCKLLSLLDAGGGRIDGDELIYTTPGGKTHIVSAWARIIDSDKIWCMVRDKSLTLAREKEVLALKDKQARMWERLEHARALVDLASTTLMQIDRRVARVSDSGKTGADSPAAR